jgi:hypothetical protein
MIISKYFLYYREHLLLNMNTCVTAWSIATLSIDNPKLTHKTLGLGSMNSGPHRYVYRAIDNSKMLY